jgi:hypothetical protein
MEKELPSEVVTICPIDMDFLRIELDRNHGRMRTTWLRQVSKKERRRGLQLALRVAVELRKELKRTRAMLRP